MVPFFSHWHITTCSSQPNPFPLFDHKQVPQGCISSPLLYTLYTNDCTATTPGNFIVKFADDSAVLTLLFAYSDIDTYFSEVNRFRTEWCTDNFLELNTGLKKNTKEIMFDPKSVCAHLPGGGYQWSNHRKLGHTSIWVFTLTANSAGVYTLSVYVPGPRNVFSFSGDSEHLVLVQTYCSCSIVVLPSKVCSDMANIFPMETCQFSPNHNSDVSQAFLQK